MGGYVCVKKEDRWKGFVSNFYDLEAWCKFYGGGEFSGVSKEGYCLVYHYDETIFCGCILYV